MTWYLASSKMYLEPTFQCDVYPITSAAGNEHPVIVVPPHGATPICAKADGPKLDGKPTGISQGVYYTRKAGPESAPIVTAAEWAPVIRRCALHDRTYVLGAIETALRGTSATSSVSIEERLKTWHDAAHQAFLKDIVEYSAPSELAKWHYQFSYAIGRSDDQQLDPAQLREMLRQVNGEVRDLVRTGWSMFYIFNRAGIEPFFNVDPASGQGEQDFLECDLLRDTETGSHDSDMWRVAPNGLLTLVRSYWEDHPEINKTRRTAPGTWFSPNTLVCSLAEIVRHARSFAERFDAPITVSFRCEWHGLSSRHLADIEGLWRDRGAVSGDHRTASGTWPVSTLASDWPKIVADLSAPVARLFGVESVVTPEWVRSEAPKWIRWS